MHEQLHHWEELFKRSTMALITLSCDVCNGSCARSNFWTPMPGCTIPASEQKLCQFVSSLAIQSLCYNTIKSYLAAIRHLHIAKGYGDPHIHDMARLEQVLKGIKAVQSKGPKKTEWLSITPNHLAKLKEVYSRGAKKFDGRMLWGAASLCFMRSGELTIPAASAYDEGAHLSFNDVAVDCVHDPHILRVRLKASKTDLFRVGVNVSVGRTGNPLCPVTAVLLYMVARGPGSGPFFRFENGSPLTRTNFVDKVRGPVHSGGGLHCLFRAQLPQWSRYNCSQTENQRYHHQDAG